MEGNNTNERVLSDAPGYYLATKKCAKGNSWHFFAVRFPPGLGLFTAALPTLGPECRSSGTFPTGFHAAL